MASKYDKLKEHLQGLSHREWHASFAEIERILGFPLPNSGRNYNAWWANEQSGSHSQARSWLDAGWETEDLNLTGGRVWFRKIGRPASPTVLQKASQPAPEPNQRTCKPAPPNPGLPEAVIQAGLRYAWLPIGTVALDRERKPVFPKCPTAPGLYRMRFRGTGQLQVYVGETDNLQRRFMHYRNPGPSQQTNIRLRDRIVGLVGNEGTVEIAILTSSAWLTLNEEESRADFSSKAMRRLFENLAQVQAEREGATLLNR